MADAIGGGPMCPHGRRPSLRRIAENEFSAEFALSLALKDLRLALDAAGGTRFPALAGLA